MRIFSKVNKKWVVFPSYINYLVNYRFLFHKIRGVVRIKHSIINDVGNKQIVFTNIIFK